MVARSAYGGETPDAGTMSQQEFVGAGGAWSLSVEPFNLLTYSYQRDEAEQTRVEFVLSRQVASPPPPWGARRVRDER